MPHSREDGPRPQASGLETPPTPCWGSLSYGPPSSSPQPSKHTPHLSPHWALKAPPAVTYPPFSLLLPQEEPVLPPLYPGTSRCQGAPRFLLGLSCFHLLVQDYKLCTSLSLHLGNLAHWINTAAGEEVGGGSLTPTCVQFQSFCVQISLCECQGHQAC